MVLLIPDPNLIDTSFDGPILGIFYNVSLYELPLSRDLTLYLLSYWVAVLTFLLIADVGFDTKEEPNVLFNSVCLAKCN